MKKLLLLPTMIFPYLVCLLFVLYPLRLKFSFLTDAYFGYYALFLVVLFFAAFICNIIYIVSSANDDHKGLLKYAFIVKAVHIVPYIFNFLLSLLMTITIFTFPLILLFMFLDFLFLWLGNMISIFALTKLLKQEELKSLAVPALICQVFYCVDVISLFVTFLKVRDQKPIKNEI